MGFVRSIKTNTYFKRFQTKYRRRRECKTDYYARRRLIQQDKNKYEAKKYRFVVRITNSKIICQITYATPTGDHVMCQADSQELSRFGLTAGLTNYPAAYCTGLLTARRILTDLKLDSLYDGVTGEDINGEYVDMYREDGEHIDDDKRPFKAILDVGLTRTTTGNRLFGALKGLSDGGVYIKHNNKRFPGYKVIMPEEKGDKKQETYDAEVHKNKIFGVEIDEYMEELKKANRDVNAQQFANWNKCLKANKTDSVVTLYTKIHAEIRKNSARVTKKVTVHTHKFNSDKTQVTDPKGNKWNRTIKLTKEQRDARVQVKLAKIVAEAQAE